MFFKHFRLSLQQVYLRRGTFREKIFILNKYCSCTTCYSRGARKLRILFTTMQEWFRLPLDILQKDWLNKPEVLAIFLHILNMAEKEDRNLNGLSLHRGQYVTSLGLLSKNTRQGKQVIRTCLSKLKEMNLISTESNYLNTIISIINYDDYFLAKKQAKDDQLKKEKPKKTKIEIVADTEKRKGKFYHELIPFVEIYGKCMIRQFFDYWSEPNKSGSKMRFEQERTWDLNRRLCRWANNNKQYDRNGNKDQNGNAEERIQTAASLVDQLLSGQ